MKSLPPFYVGQRVIAIVTAKHEYGKVYKGREYIILGMHQCNCGKWRVDVGLTTRPAGHQMCSGCKTLLHEFSHIVYASARLFVPIESQFQPITYEAVLENEAPLISKN